MDNTALLAMGIALGIGIAVVFMLHDISINMRLKTQSPAEPTVNYVYDEQNRLKSIVPVVLNPM